jgi:transcriptional regulator with XRE-family HTH domain
MADRDEFGPHLRAARLQRGITLAQIARTTKVSEELWDRLERNDLSRWPGGIFARSYVRAYAVQVGLDPETTVNEFCRCFPAGDRRAGRTVREQAAILGHETKWRDDIEPPEGDRRAGNQAADAAGTAASSIVTKGGRPLAAAGDAAAVLLISTAAAFTLHAPWAVVAAICAIAYHGVSLIALGGTPAVWAIDTYLASRRPSDRRATYLKILKSSHP